MAKKSYRKIEAPTDVESYERHIVRERAERVTAKNDRIVGAGYAERQIADTLSKVKPIDVHISRVVGKNMEGLIKRGRAVETLAAYFPEDRAKWIEIFAAILEGVPEVKAKRGQWIRDADKELRAPGLHQYFCSCCYNYNDTRSPYCPNCGASMRK